MKKLVTIAVISDLHCHSTGNVGSPSFLKTGELRVPAGQHPVESLAELISSDELNAEVLVCPGDIADKVDIAGLELGWDVLKEIANELGVEVLVATPGNHDVDSHGTHDEDPFRVLRNFRPREFPFRDTKAAQVFWEKGFVNIDAPNCTVLVLSSVRRHFSLELASRGSVEEQMLEELEVHLEQIHRSERAKRRLAVVHHHPLQHEKLSLGSDDLMKNGQQLVELLEKFSYSLVVHGHKHHPQIRYASGGSESPTIFAAGSFAATDVRLLTNTRNLFHLVEFFEDGPGCVGSGVVRSWEFRFSRGWDVASPTSADFPAVAGFGYRGSLGSLAAKIGTWCRAYGGPLINWTDVVANYPSTEFLLPSDLKTLLVRVERISGFQCWPKPPEQPQFLAAMGVR